MAISDTGHPLGVYYGRKLKADVPGKNLLPSPHLAYANQTNYSADHPRTVLETTRLEYSGPGKGDYRDPSCIPVSSGGDRTFDFTYKSHRILRNKQALDGLPSAAVCVAATSENNVPTLELELEDAVLGVRLILSYSPLADCDVICRSARFVNDSGSSIALERAMSVCLDLELPDWELITLDGAWIRERHINRRSLGPGKTEISSRKGASSSDHSPFIALAAPGTSTGQGEVYGASLIYSGNHSCAVERSPHSLIRIQLGINPDGFRHILESGASFQTPEAVLSFSGDGLNGLSGNFHKLINNHIVPPGWRNRHRPILVNNWEATYLDFTEKKLLALAGEAASAGMELFVLDDGWFGKRDRDDSSLGDWFAHRKKLPEGLGRLADKIRSRGLDFGIWVEPEMISEDSDLYRSHPEWMIRAPGRTPSPGRNQFFIDLVNPDVRAYLFEILSKVFSEAGVSYVKWDMNRNFSDACSPVLSPEAQGEFTHRYILGLYDLLRRITDAFPDVLFEACAAGGNRFDMGILAFMPQVWTSDNSDAAERLDIQEGTSMFAPVSAICAHISGLPNHQTLRNTPIETRFNVAAFGLLGYELDLTALTSFERKVIKKQVSFYKEHRMLLQFGRFHRLEHPEAPNGYAWISVSENRREAVLGIYQKLSHPNPGSLRIPLAGLDPELIYEVNGREQYMDIHDMGALASRALPVKLNPGGKAFDALADRYLYPLESFHTLAGGDELMQAGLRPPQRFHGGGYDETIAITGDFASRLYVIKAV